MQGAPHYRQHPLPPTSGSHSSNLRFPGFPAALFPALTIALLVSAPGVDACVHTHGASMKLVDGPSFPVKQEGSDTAPTARSAAMVCCIGEGMGIWVWLGAGVGGCTCGPATFRALCVYVYVTCVSVRCPLWQSVLVALPRCLQPAPYHGSWSCNVSIVTDILA